MAARIIAQVVVAGATVVFRAATQAWAQALVNAQKSGVAQEAAQAGAQAIKKASTMAVQEAQMILEVKEGASWGDVVKRFKHLFEVNEKHGSFYLQSKVYRAREAIEEEYKRLGLFDPTVEAEEPKGDQGAKEGQGQGGQKQ